MLPIQLHRIRVEFMGSLLGAGAGILGSALGAGGILNIRDNLWQMNSQM